MSQKGSPAEQAGEDAARIGAALHGLDPGTDPFVAAVRTTRMPMIITNPRLPDNPVVFANDAFCRITGYGRDEILGRNCRFLQGTDTDPATVRLIHEAVENVRSIEIDIRNYRKDGDWFWNRLLLAPVHDAEGKLAFFFASQMDVTTERERMAGLESDNAALTARLAAQLHDQEERESELRFALDAGRFGAWTLELATGEFTTSGACRLNFGRQADLPFPYEAFRAVTHPDDQARVEAALSHSILTGRDYEIEYRALAPDGERWIALRARPIRGQDGSVVRLSGVSQDITDAKRAERFRQALVDLGALFRDGHSTADVAAAAGQILGRTLGASRAGYGTIDAGRETIEIERDWNAPDVEVLPTQLLHFRTFGSYIEELKRGETVVMENAEDDPRTAPTVNALKAIGAQAFINMPVNEQGGLVALIYVCHAAARRWLADELAFVWEVAHRTRAAIERQRAEQDLAHLASSLEQQVAERTRALMAAEEALRQSQKLEAIGQLTGGVAHDFNNLLTVISSSVDLMRRPNLPEERRRRYIDAIAETVTRAARLTGQLLAFARRQALRPEVFEAGERILAIAEMMDTVTGARIQVIVEPPERPCFVRADVSQFETALVNMAVNARDAMDGAGVLTLSLQPSNGIPAIRDHGASSGRFVAITMTDTGQGIGPDRLDRIFEPFFTTKEVGKGTGLGLSQVFGFAKQSGGDVAVASTLGQGATFTLYLPEIDPPAIADFDGGPAASAGMSVGGGGRRVLVVEDNTEVGRFSTQVLQDLGYETTWAGNAEEAMAALAGADEPFDIVFSDVVMPGRSGIELARDIGQVYPGLPVVLTSGYSHVLAERGASGFELLQKPYSADQLSSVLRRAMGRAARPPRRGEA